jgi:hypothetical protein
MILQTYGDADDYPYYEETVTESSWHYKAIEYLHSALGNRYADRQDVFVGANNFRWWPIGSVPGGDSYSGMSIWLAMRLC